MTIAAIDRLRNIERTHPWNNADGVRAENVKLKRKVESLRNVLAMTGDVEPAEPVAQMPQTGRCRTVSTVNPDDGETL